MPRKAMILDRGARFTPLSVSPEGPRKGKGGGGGRVLASRKFTAAEICRVFAVPPPIVQSYEHNTFTNSSQAEQWFAQRTLLP